MRWSESARGVRIILRTAGLLQNGGSPHGKTRDSPQQLRELTRGEREAVRRDGGGDGAAGQPERGNLFQRRNHFLEKLDLIEQRFERARKKTNVNVADATSRYLTNKVA